MLEEHRTLLVKSIHERDGLDEEACDDGSGYYPLRIKELYCDGSELRDAMDKYLSR